MKVEELNSGLQQLIVSLYKQGISVNTIAKNERIPFSSPHSILKVLRMNNIPIRSRAGYRQEYKEDFFEVIDLESKAYFLGLLITDGYVILREKEHSQPTIGIELHSNDIHILQTFKKELESPNKVETSRQRKDGRIHSRFRIHSSIMANSLKKYGVVPNKTQTTFLPFLETGMMPHLIRGILDGDGWIQSKGIKKGSKRRIGFCSASEQFIYQLRGFLNKELGTYLIKVQKRKKDKSYLYQLLFCGEKDVNTIINYLYKDATVYLTRKHDLIKDLIS